MGDVGCLPSKPAVQTKSPVVSKQISLTEAVWGLYVFRRVPAKSRIWTYPACVPRALEMDFMDNLSRYSQIISPFSGIWQGTQLSLSWRGLAWNHLFARTSAQALHRLRHHCLFHYPHCYLLLLLYPPAHPRARVHAHSLRLLQNCPVGV